MKTTYIFSLIICIVLFSSLTNAQHWSQAIKVCGSDRDGEDFYGQSVAIDGDLAIVGAWGQNKNAPAGGVTLLEAGAAYILQNIDDTWVEVQKIVASDRGPKDNFGYSVDIKGDYAVVGAWKEESDENSENPILGAGAVYIFYNNAGIWQEVQKIVPLSRTPHQHFGNSVSIDGDFIVVGSLDNAVDEIGDNTLTSAGAIYIFQNNGTNWSQTQKIVPLDRAAAAFFGNSVSINGNYIIAGAYNKSENSLISTGAAYVFYYNGSVWSQIQKLVSPVLKTSGYFGSDVVINDNFAVVGARGEYENEFITNTGAAYIYSNPGTGEGLSFLSKIAADDQQSNDNFGCSVDVDGDYIVVGAYNHSLDKNGLNLMTFAGAAYIYHNDEFEWTQEQKIVNLDRKPVDYFGFDVAISNNYIIAGAMNQDFDAEGEDEKPEAGAAYIFHNCREIFVYQDTTEIENKGIFDFGDVEIGSSSQELIFTIENIGVDNLILDGTPIIKIYGTNATDFEVNQSVTSSPIVPGGSTTFTITFTPSFIGLHTAEISISNNDYEKNPFIFTLIGVGIKIPQIISEFNSIDVKTYGDNDFIVSATASSGLDVIFTSSDNNIAICGGINGSNITITGAGFCEIYANQPGNEFYLAAPQDSQTLIVNKKPITVTADAEQTKEYGNSDPVLTYTVSPDGLEIGDNFTGTLTRVAGETVGIYEIHIGTLSAGPNYEITFITDYFVITERIIHVTADVNQSKTYGQSDPLLTYSYYPNIINGDAFTGSLTRVEGENIGYYEIQQGSLSLNYNYIIDYTSNSFEIIAKAITVTPNANQSKIYGTSDPNLFTYTLSSALAFEDTFSGALSRVAGEDVGFYTITVGTLDAGDNYVIMVTNEFFEIIAKPITATAYSDQSKLYGNNDPTFAYWLMGTLEDGDELTGELSREPGEDLGFYAITQGTLSIGSNYNLSFVPANFQIKVKGLLVKVDPNQTKEYGDADPVFTYTANWSLAPGDNFTGELVRVAGENVGSYMITQGTLALNSNYSITFMGDEFEITFKPITVTANPNQTKYYGEANPTEYTYTYTGILLNNDSFSGALTRQAGESVGAYDILQGGLWLGPNYQIIFNSDIFEILHNEISIVANAGQTKTYGNADPTEYTFTYTGTLAVGDYFIGSLTREEGENIGFYEIQQGNLYLNNNYNIAYHPNNFEITEKHISVTANANQLKIYGEDDPTEFTYTVSELLIGNDVFTGSLTRILGEDVGSYEIQQGSLSLNSNYNMSYYPNDFEITPKTITVTADTNQSKIYGEDDPTEFTYTVSELLIGNDVFTGSLTRILGEDVGSYEIQQGNLNLTNNYNLTYYPNDFTITERLITVTANANQSKIYGEDDPSEFTYTVSESLLGNDSFTGWLTRESGENTGHYEILQGSLNLGNNYVIIYHSDSFEIVKAIPIITWENPEDIYFGAELTENQLNAMANTSGSFYYNPDFNTILEVGDNQALNVEFIPDDSFNYNNADATVYINVLFNNSIDKYRTSIEVYPNPAKDFVYIVQENTFFEYLKVYDITGKVVIQQSLSDLTTSLNISYLKSGVYFIALKIVNSPKEIRIKLVKTDN